MLSAMRPERWMIAGLLLLAGCDRQGPPAQTGDPEQPAQTDRTTTSAATAATTETETTTETDPWAVWPGPNGGERYRLGADLAMLELRVSRTAPQVQVWIWNMDMTALLPQPQDTLDLQIAPIHREGPGRPGNFTLRLTAPTPADRAAHGFTGHFVGGSPRMRGLRTFEAQLGPLLVRGHQVGGMPLRYPYARVLDPADDD